MKKVLLMLFGLCIVSVSWSDSHKVGPYPNAKEWVEQEAQILVPSTIDFEIYDPIAGEFHHVAGRGGQVFDITYTLPVFAYSYAEFDSSQEFPFDPKKGPLRLTEIWARDLQPELPKDEIPEGEGFDPGSVIPGHGFFKGRSGQIYDAIIEEVPVGLLPTILPGYDVGMIIGNSQKVVYVAQANVPASEFIIEQPSPYFLLDSQHEWQSKLEAEWPNVYIAPLSIEEWDNYFGQVMGAFGGPYPQATFLPPELYVHEGGGSGGTDPEDAGLVMKWGDENTPDGDYSGAWKLDYGDPDLSNCIINVTVTPPSGINSVSLGLQDIFGNIRSWQWTCGLGGILQHNVPNTITIDTTQYVTAATPGASAFFDHPAFDLTQVQMIIAEENGNPAGGIFAPPPGSSIPAIWNYWHNLSVTKKTAAYKGTYVKWSQPPDLLNQEGDVPLINGWDEKSVYRPKQRPIMADDWLCTDDRPITDLHWWGSFIGWTQPDLPPVLPRAFHIGIWTDVPANPDDPQSFSHPGVMIWEHICDKWVWNFAGYDVDPRCNYPDLPCEKNEACFQFNQLLSQDDWFYQEPGAGEEGRVYWISIAAIYDADVQEIRYPWGWKTRPHFYNDNAVRIQAVFDPTGLNIWPPKLGSIWADGKPVALPPYPHPEAVSWDLAFELTTNEKAYIDEPIPGDIGGPGGSLVPDGTVNLHDLTIMASNWLVSVP